MHIKPQPSGLYLSASWLIIAALICYLGCIPILTGEALHSWRSLRSPSPYPGYGYDAPMMAASASASASSSASAASAASAAASVASHLPGRGGYSAVSLPLGKRKPKWAASFGNSFKAKAHNLSTRLFHENPNYGHNFLRNHAQYTEQYSRTYTTSRAGSGIIHHASTTYFEPIKVKNSRKNSRAPIRRRSKADKNRRPPPSNIAVQPVQDSDFQVEPSEANMNQENTFVGPDQGMLGSLSSSSAAATATTATAASSSGSQMRSLPAHEHAFQSDATNEQETSQVFNKRGRSEENVSDLNAGLEGQRTLGEGLPISIESKAKPISEITRSEYESALAGEHDSDSSGLHEAQPEGSASETIEAKTNAADPEFSQPLTARHDIREVENPGQIREDQDSPGKAVNVAHSNDASTDEPVETSSSNADDSPNEIATGLEEGISKSLPIADSDEANHEAPSSAEFSTGPAETLNSDATDDSKLNQEVAQEVPSLDDQNLLVSDADREITPSRLGEQLGQSDRPMHEDESINNNGKSGGDTDDSSPNEAVKNELDSPESSQTDPKQEDKAEDLNSESKEDAAHALGEVANLSDGVYEVAESDGDSKPVEEKESDNTEGAGDNSSNEFENPNSGESSPEDQRKADKTVSAEPSKENEEQNNDVDTSNQDTQNSVESSVADESAKDDNDREKIPEEAKSVSGDSDNNSSTGENVAMSEQSDAQQAEANENTSAESNNGGTSKNKRNRRKHRKSNKKDPAGEDQAKVSLEETKEVENRRRSKKTSAVTEETDEITSEKSIKKLEVGKSDKKGRRNRRNRRRRGKKNKQDTKDISADEKQEEDTHLSKQSQTSGEQNKMGSSESSDHPATPPEEVPQSSSDLPEEQSQEKTEARDETKPSNQQEEASKIDHEEDDSPAIADKPSRRYSYLRNGKAFRSTSEVNEMLMKHLGKNSDPTEVKDKPVAKSESNDNKENVSPTSDEIKAELASMPLPPMLDDNSLVKSEDQMYGTGKTNTNRNRVTKLNHRISIKDEDWSPKRELKSKEGGANVEEDGENFSANERKRILREKSLPLAKKLSRSIDKDDQVLASAKSNGKIKPISYKSTHKKVKVGDR